MSRHPHPAPSSGAWLFVLRHLLGYVARTRRERVGHQDARAGDRAPLVGDSGPGATTGFCQGGRWPEYDKWSGRGHNAVFNPGTAAPLAVSLWFNPSTLGGTLFSKAGEYELHLLTDKLALRVATNTGGGSWDKEVEVSHSITTGWHHALFWIEPGVEIGLVLDGGTPDTESLDPGQAARVVNGSVLVGYPAPPPPSSSWHYSSWHSSSWHHSSSWWPLAAEAFADPHPYVGLVDEIAVFNDALGAGWRAALYNGGAGLFWHAGTSTWGPCGGGSSSWHWSSSYHWSSHQSSSWHYSSWHSSWWSWMEMGAGGAGGGGHAAMSKAAAMPVTGPLLTLAESAPPERTLCQYVWGARAGHRDELVLRDRDSTGGGGGTLDERLYSLMDYFDPVAVVDREGEVVERYAWTAFGRREVMAPDWAPRETSLLDWSFGFHGQFLDGETGYYNYGYRYYVPWLGRWPNRDPIGETGGVNLYGMVKNNTVRGNDFLGLAEVQVTITIAEDFFSGGAILPNMTLPGKHYTVFGEVNWTDLLADIESDLDSDDCISNIVIGSHGNSGLIANANLAAIRLNHLGFNDFLEGIERLKCEDRCVMLVLSCKVAKGEAGQRFISKVAKISGFEVRAFDDTYAIIPHGTLWEASSDGVTITPLATFGSYQDSTLKWFADRLDSKNDKKKKDGDNDDKSNCCCIKKERK